MKTALLQLALTLLKAKGGSDGPAAHEDAFSVN